jgi:hypothetical protein
MAGALSRIHQNALRVRQVDASTIGGPLAVTRVPRP